MKNKKQYTTLYTKGWQKFWKNILLKFLCSLSHPSLFVILKSHLVIPSLKGILQSLIFQFLPFCLSLCWSHALLSIFLPFFSELTSLIHKPTFTAFSFPVTLQYWEVISASNLPLPLPVKFSNLSSFLTSCATTGRAASSPLQGWPLELLYIMITKKPKTWARYANAELPTDLTFCLILKGNFCKQKLISGSGFVDGHALVYDL